MFVTWKDYLAGCCSHDEQIEIAARHRRQHQELGVDTELPEPCCRLLVWFARRLKRWGAALEAKYDYIHRSAIGSHS
jgi:hypothetical protein